MKKLYAYSDELEKKIDEFDKVCEAEDESGFNSLMGISDILETSFGECMLKYFEKVFGIPEDIMNKKFSDYTEEDIKLMDKLLGDERIIRFTRT